MRKLISILLVTVLSISFSLPVSASEPLSAVQTEVEDLGNGLYGITTIEVPSGNARALKNATKTYTLKTESGSVVASFKLTASFTYPTITGATCTSVSHSTTISDSKWSFSEKSSSKSGNTATGSFTANLKSFGITVQTISRTITLTCDKYGNIS